MSNSATVIETKRRLAEHSATLIKSGGPHQQQLATDIATLIRAHDAAIIEVNDPAGRIAELEKALQGQSDLAVETLNQLDEATKERDEAQVKLAALQGLGIAAVGEDFATIRRKLIEANGPLIRLDLDGETDAQSA